MDAVKEYHVLNLGAGVQSTTLYLLDERLKGEGKLRGLRYDVAIFADTQAEPEAVYYHLGWLTDYGLACGGPPIWTRTRGNLRHDLLHGFNRGKAGKTAVGFKQIPVFLSTDGGKLEGKANRHCTQHYKVAVIEQAIKRELLGVQYRRRVPKGVVVHRYFGFSVDEARRSAKVRERIGKNKWQVPHFPLLDLGWSRRGCQEWLKDKVPHEVPRSACTFCPFRRDQEWKKLREQDPAGWQSAVDLDKHLRAPATDAARRAASAKGMAKQMYLHRSCIPLEMVDFDNLPPQTLEPFTLYDCVGMCGV